MPVYRAVEFECFVGLFTCQFPKGGVRLVGEKGTSDIVKARNSIRANVASGPNEFSLWVDADVMVPSDTVVRLMRTLENYGAMVVTGLYRGRTSPHKITCYAETDGGDNYIHAFDDGIPDGDVHSIDACGAGCMLVRNEVFRMGAGFDREGSFSEDLSFCRAVKRLAKTHPEHSQHWPIYANSAVKCGHTTDTLVEI